MVGIQPGVAFSSVRIRARFQYDLGGNPRVVSGTAFVLNVEGREKQAVVTNRHLVDPAMALQNDDPDGWHLEGVEVELRAYRGDEPTKLRVWATVETLTDSLRLAEDADCAVLLNPTIALRGVQFGDMHFRLAPGLAVGELADQEWLRHNVEMMDNLSFIGFPGDDGEPWWDQSLGLPIARHASIASWPKTPFSNPSVMTSDTVVVSGFSFSGSSGSPVFSHQKGIPGLSYGGKDHVRPKLLGIMSGHWQIPAAVPKMFLHSGLSYFTRATSIIPLIQGQQHST